MDTGMDVTQSHDVKQIDQDMARLIADAEQAAETVRQTLAGAQQTRDDIIARAETDALAIREKANEDAGNVVQETRDRAEQMLHAAQSEADRIVEEARRIQTQLSGYLPQLENMIAEINPLLTGLGEVSESAHLTVADAMDDLEVPGGGWEQGGDPAAQFDADAGWGGDALNT